MLWLNLKGLYYSCSTKALSLHGTTIKLNMIILYVHIYHVRYNTAAI